MNGAEYIIKFLKRKDVDTIFGYPGAAVLELYDALYNSDIRHILTRHEQGAVHSAVGYAKMSGKIGICIATSGPGATNLITGIADAYLDSQPLIVITGQVDVKSIGQDAFQEADIMGITIPITKHNYLVKESSNLCLVLEEAWRIASTNRKGPVLIDIAKNIFSAEIADCTPTDVILPRVRKNDFVLEYQLISLKAAIENSYRPLILAGGGVVADSAALPLFKFAQQSNIPISTTLMAKSIGFNEDDDEYNNIRFLGMSGMYGNDRANAALSQCDLLIAVGTRFSDRTISNYELYSHSRMVIHCDIDPAEISKNVTADIAVVCGANQFFEKLLSLNINYKSFKMWNEMLNSFSKTLDLSLSEDTLSSREIIRLINSIEKQKKSAVFVTDVGNHQMVAAQEIDSIVERGFITSGGLGAMGFGLPAAIGASAALDKSALVNQIILFCGDGGFQMTMQELSTLNKVKLPIKIFIFDNNALGMVRDIQKNNYDMRFIATDLNNNPNFEVIGQAYGIKTRRIDVLDKYCLKSKLDEILNYDFSMIIHCVVNI